MKRPNTPVLLIGGALALALAIGSHAGATPADNHDVANRLIAQFVQAENTMSTANFDRIFPENYIQHHAGIGQGRAVVKQFFEDQFKDFAKQKITVHSTAEDIVVDGDRVVLRQLTTFQKGAKHYEERSLDEWRIVNGQLAEHWDSDPAPHPVHR